MAYSQFTMERLRREFNLTATAETALFAAAPAAQISDWLRESLRRQTDVALISGSEKARSEFLIASILIEAFEQSRDRASLFSGMDFKVDETRGLDGFCDFLFTLTPRSIEILAPVISVVEAKKEDIPKGIPQCLAELVAAQIFNAAEGRPIDTLYGIVTTGDGYGNSCAFREQPLRLTPTTTFLISRKRLLESFFPCCDNEKLQQWQTNQKPRRTFFNVRRGFWFHSSLVVFVFDGGEETRTPVPSAQSAASTSVVFVYISRSSVTKPKANESLLSWYNTCNTFEIQKEESQWRWKQSVVKSLTAVWSSLPNGCGRNVSRWRRGLPNWKI